MAKVRVPTPLGPIEFENPEDAARFVREFVRPETFAEAARGRPAQIGGFVAPKRTVQKGRKEAITLLEAVLVADRISSVDLAEKLGRAGPRGMASVVGPVTEELLQVGMKLEDLIRIERKRSGTIWAAKDPGEIRRAIAELCAAG